MNIWHFSLYFNFILLEKLLDSQSSVRLVTYKTSLWIILVTVHSFLTAKLLPYFLYYLCVLHFLSVRLNYRRGKTNRLYGNFLLYTPSFSLFSVHKKGMQNEFCCAAQLLHAPFSSSSSFLWLGQYLISSSCASSGCVRLVIELFRLTKCSTF